MPLAAARRAGIGCAFVGVWEGRRGSRSGRAGRRAGRRGGKGSGEGNGGAPAALFATGRPVGNGGQRLALLALGRGGGCGCAPPWPGWLPSSLSSASPTSSAIILAPRLSPAAPDWLRRLPLQGNYGRQRVPGSRCSGWGEGGRRTRSPTSSRGGENALGREAADARGL